VFVRCVCVVVWVRVRGCISFTAHSLQSVLYCILVSDATWKKNIELTSKTNEVLGSLPSFVRSPPRFLERKLLRENFRA
jgi:hypothetical protein